MATLVSYISHKNTRTTFQPTIQRHAKDKMKRRNLSFSSDLYALSFTRCSLWMGRSGEILRGKA